MANRLCTLRPDINLTDETQPPNGLARLRGSMSAIRITRGYLARAVDDGHTEFSHRSAPVAPRTKNQVSESVVFVGQGAMFAPEGDFYIAPYARGIDETCNLAFRPLEVRLGRKSSRRRTARLTRTSARALNRESSKTSMGPLVKTGIAQSVRVLIDPDALVNTSPPVTVPVSISIDMGAYIDAWTVDISLS